MSEDKRKVSTDALETLGTIIGDTENRNDFYMRDIKFSIELDKSYALEMFKEIYQESIDFYNRTISDYQKKYSELKNIIHCEDSNSKSLEDVKSRCEEIKKEITDLYIKLYAFEYALKMLNSDK